MIRGRIRWQWVREGSGNKRWKVHVWNGRTWSACGFAGEVTCFAPTSTNALPDTAWIEAEGEAHGLEPGMHREVARLTIHQISAHA